MWQSNNGKVDQKDQNNAILQPNSIDMYLYQWKNEKSIILICTNSNKQANWSKNFCGSMWNVREKKRLYQLLCLCAVALHLFICDDMYLYHNYNDLNSIRARIKQQKHQQHYHILWACIISRLDMYLKKYNIFFIFSLI